jgi:hypothetical protein
MVPECESAILGYIISEPHDEESFGKLKRSHFSHALSSFVFSVVHDVKEAGELSLSAIATEAKRRDPKFKPSVISEWMIQGDSNAFSVFYEELDQLAKDREEGGIRFYFSEKPKSQAQARFIQDCQYPKDSIIHLFVKQMQKVAEASDSLIIGCAIGIIGGLLGRNVWFNFGTRKHPNVYAILSARPGGGKSSVINLAEQLFHDVTGSSAPDRLLCDENSVQSLFDEFHENPDRVWICDDGNATLHSWATSIQGAGVSKQFLRLYDCKGLSENYRRNKGDESESGKRTIPGTSLNLILGCTFSALRDHRIQAKDGLRRRFLNYTSTGSDRVIYYPESPNPETWEKLVQLFKQILEFKGEVTLSEAAKPIWEEFQRSNREQRQEAESEELESLLCESPSHALKLSMIFQAARSAAGNVPWNVISPETLQLAISHVQGCVEAAESIDGSNQSEHLQEVEEFVMAAINDPVSEFKRLTGTDAILATQTQLTRRFSSHGNRSKITGKDLKRVIKSLTDKGLCAVHVKIGKAITYRFKNESAG